jgi:hypothetical protein
MAPGDLFAVQGGHQRIDDGFTRAVDELNRQTGEVRHVLDGLVVAVLGAHDNAPAIGRGLLRAEKRRSRLQTVARF